MKDFSKNRREILFGHTELREKTLRHFSAGIKEQKLWSILQNNFQTSMIKENQKFPIIGLKTHELEDQKLSLPTAKYMLVDFWFSSCAPCLDAPPH